MKEYKKEKVKDINLNIYFVIEFYATIHPGDEKQNRCNNSMYQIKMLNKRVTKSDIASSLQCTL